MIKVYNKYLNESIDSKTKREILSFLDISPDRKINKLKINGIDVNIHNIGNKTYDVYFEYDKSFIELTEYLTDIIDDMSNRKFKVEETGKFIKFHVTGK